MIDLNDLRIFDRVAALGGFSGASKALGLPKSSVSRAIARLEKKLGIRLFQRTTRDVRLTPVGQALHGRSADLLVDLTNAVDIVAGFAGAPRGTLAISAGVGFGINVLSRQLPDFLARYPDVSITLDLTSREADLVADRIDVAIRMGPLPDSAMVAVRLGGMNRYLCASRGYVALRGLPAHPNDLSGHDIIDMPTANGRPRPLSLTRNAETARLELTPRLAVNEALTIHRLIAAGAGIGVLSAYLCGDEIMAGNLVHVLPDWSLPPLDVTMLFPSNREISPTVRAFVDYMKAVNPPGETWRRDPLRAAPASGLGGQAG